MQLQRVRIAHISRTLLALTDEYSTTTSSSANGSHMHIMHTPAAVAAAAVAAATNTSTATTVRHTSTGINPPPSSSTAAVTADANNRLKQRIRELGDDVLEKSQYIAILERERKTLIREVLQAQRGAPAWMAASQTRTSTTTTTDRNSSKPHHQRTEMRNQVNF